MSTPTDKDTDRLERRAKALFDDSVERLDGATLSKLNQGRQAALAEVEGSATGIHWGRWLPATGAVAAAAVVAVMVVQGPESQLDPPDVASTDFEILIGEDDLDMIEELEFYSWLEVADLETTDNVG